MNILMITANDPAGMGIAFTNALNRYTDHTCRLITTAEKYGFEYEADIHLPNIHDDDYGEVEDLLQKADVIHFHVLNDENSLLGPLIIRDYIKGKKILHHHHGHPDFRINIDGYNQKYRKLGRKVIVSTPDLLQITENAIWVPNLVPINDVHYLPRFEDTLPEQPIRICQAPTKKFLKNTGVFKQAVSELQGTGRQIEPVILERLPHTECLKLKRSCHLIFDHMWGWFGISSLESLSQGKPVIAGLDDWNIRCIKEFTGADELPWLVARDGDQLQSILTEYVDDRGKRTGAGMASRAFMEKYWTEEHALGILLDVYKGL